MKNFPDLGTAIIVEISLKLLKLKFKKNGQGLGKNDVNRVAKKTRESKHLIFLTDFIIELADLVNCLVDYSVGRFSW